MAGEVCTHCDDFINGRDKTVRNGYSYHKQCERCYVCNEVNLQGAQTFMGVILCAGCAERIFQGCMWAKTSKNPTEANKKSTATKVPKKREKRSHKRRNKGNDKSVLRNGVIEIAAMAGLTDTDSGGSIHTAKIRSPLPKKVFTAEVIQDKKGSANDTKENSAEMGVTTDITQELLRAIHFPNKIQCNAVPAVQPKPRPKSKWFEKKNIERKVEKKCSDLRIAELGQSTEMASISASAKRPKEQPLIIKSENDFTTKKSDSIEDSEDWSEGNLSTIEESRRWLDRRLGSIIRMPIDYFKENILARSSLASIAMQSQDKRTCLSKFRLLFKAESAEHQKSGMRKLYSTIHRRQIPNKLGWLRTVSKVTVGTSHQLSLRLDSRASKLKSRRKRGCKHIRTSHSYRCMRKQVMKLAGPTKSELAEIRRKIKNFGVSEPLRLVRSIKYGDMESKGCDKISTLKAISWHS